MGAPIRVTITGDSQGLKAAVGEANASLRQLQSSASQSQASLQKIDGAFDSLSRGAARVAGLSAVAVGLQQVLASASAVQQSTGALEAVFAGQADAMKANAEAATKLGLSTSAYGELAARLGSQLKNLGVPLEQVGGKTDEMIRLGADLAAMFGGTTSQAVEALSSAFKGELDPIERYGVTLSAAAVSAEMSSKGISKAQATMNLIMAQTGDAAGAAGREYGSYASVMQRVAAETENAKAKVGEGLLPVFSALGTVAAGVVGAVGAIPAPLLTAAGAAGVAVVAYKAYASAVALAAARTEAMYVASLASGGTFRGLAAGLASSALSAAALGPMLALVAGSAAAAAFAIKTYNAQVAAAQPTLDEMTLRVRTLDGDLRNLSTQGSVDWSIGEDAVNAAASIENLGDALDYLGKQDASSKFDRWRDSLNPFTDATDESKRAILDTAAALGELYKTNPGEAVTQGSELLRLIQQQTGDSQLLKDATEALGGAQGAAAVMANQQAGSVQGLAQAYKDASGAQSEFAAILAGLSDPFLKAQQAEAAWNEAIVATAQAADAAAAAVAAGGTAAVTAAGGFDMSSESGRNAAAALGGMTEAAMANLVAMAGNGATAAQLQQAQQTMATQVYAAGLQMGLSRDEALKYAKGIRDIPPEAITKVTADTAAANASIDETRRKLDGIVDRTIYYTFKASGAGGADMIWDPVTGRPLPLSAPVPDGPSLPAIGQLQPHPQTNVAVYVDGVRTPARVAPDPLMSPALAGVL